MLDRRPQRGAPAETLGELSEEGVVRARVGVQPATQDGHDAAGAALLVPALPLAPGHSGHFRSDRQARGSDAPPRAPSALVASTQLAHGAADALRPIKAGRHLSRREARAEPGQIHLPGCAPPA